jgi:hypothetical protein
MKILSNSLITLAVTTISFPVPQLVVAFTLTSKGAVIGPINSFSSSPFCKTQSSLCFAKNSDKFGEWTSDFDDYMDDDDDEGKPNIFFSNILRGSRDLSASEARQFSLGKDLILSDFVGKMGFEEVTDWEYYYENEENPTDRKVVQPNPFDESKPKRTRSSSGSVVRVFRGEFVGPLGSTLRSQGFDSRILIKEFSGKMALELARRELKAVGKLQSDLLLAKGVPRTELEQWAQTASSRSASERLDNANIADLLTCLRKAPFLGILGEVNMAELEGEMDANEFYRAMGVAAPQSGAIWIVYEYAGLSTIGSYAVPAETRRSQMAPRRSVFGVSEPPPVPAWRERADYVVKGLMKGALEAVATLHDGGIVHRSVGKGSLLISSTRQDKQEAASIYTTNRNDLVVKIADFGFAGLMSEVTESDEFLARARMFGLSVRKGDNSLAATNFAMAEDLHALGFVFLGLLLPSLAKPAKPGDPLPATDEDTLQRLLGDIFEKDIEQFRDYLSAEEAWNDLVALLDENDRAGWKLLDAIFKAREKVAENRNNAQIISARGLLSNPFFR